MAERVYIFDTTLRDGEQSPGVALNTQEKLEIAEQLARLKVDVIEAGFPISSPGDYQAVKAIAQQVRGPVIAALARIAREDIDRAWDAVRYAENPRLHIFVATSDLHLKYKLNLTREEVLEQAGAAVRYAARYTSDVEFSTEDGSRSDRDFLCRVVETAIKAGAKVINIPDTVGYATPDEYAAFLREVRERVPGMDRVILSVHCHNDLGMATANSLAGVMAGARQVECAVNGIGERAGNCSLEEVVMALYTRRDFYKLTTGIDSKEIYRTSRLVSSLSGMPIQPNKAVVGKNAFSHQSGIHQDGVLKQRTTYEIMDADTIGITTDNIVLGKLSGRHAFAVKLEKLGYKLEGEELNQAFARFKEMADRKREITDRDLEAIVASEVRLAPERYRLVEFKVITGSKEKPAAWVTVSVDGELRQAEGSGEGPVDAILNAVDTVTGLPASLKHYALNAVTSGRDALGEVTVQVEHDGRAIVGRGASMDILESSARAYLDALNKLVQAVGEEGLRAKAPATGSEAKEG